ncbi:MULTISPECIES: UDP-N-acetylmuramoyl-tripeptide--D-alanyl-D-alanine ligase [Bacteroidales]|jgi:UDP-N-acetylmuramoyl-tripeptide--D-alanyl-D-alanine ligase|uniref:UDP-N-acetylmuramoyl-tripeptide--D-alanyl-D- alanine ligase n=1 Tax=Bacteroidales TaxID=171549 RepID=UPI0005739E6C|nr:MULTISPECIES: UDP-N-acetylmuramoyl-tripeptide--D-alanyl-D-alanine ligase [Bacteroidales]KHM48527.1 UDP-N-acetylmuramoyl-tripeptide--D-alanyl-D-alanine ligase [Coprobacter secundus]
MEINDLYTLYKQYPTITTDSRKCVPGSIFFALKGENFNGNQFATQALKEGCSYAIVDEADYVTDDKRIILVDNCLSTLQALAHYHRKILGLPIIGITGTNGKTTTKELTAACLAQKFNVLATEGNLNNHIGVPLTLLKLTSSHEIAIIEMGASHPGDIKELVEITEPNYGIITNVGKAHLQGFGSFEGVLQTKCEMYDFIRTHKGHIFIQHENLYLQPQSNGIEKTEYGISENLFISGSIIDCSPFLFFEMKHNNISIKIQTQLIGSYNLTNALAAAAIAVYFGVKPNKIKDAIETYIPQNKRSQLQKTKYNTLIIDAYNANPTSMGAALDNFVQIKANHKAVILGNMGELGIESENEHRKIIGRLQEANFDKVLLSGNEFCKIDNNFECFSSTNNLIEELKKNPLKGYTILIKGSRSTQLERCIEWL